MRLATVALTATACSMDIPIGIIEAPPSPTTTVVLPAPVDSDLDGFTSEMGDCDDLEPRTGPADAYREVCDGIDNDCDGYVDQFSDGAPLCERADTFDQVTQADVLYVVDHYSTYEYVDPGFAHAGEGAYAMARHLVGAGMDTHVGVLSYNMDVRPGALLAPSQYTGSSWITGDESTLSLGTVFNFLNWAVIDQVPQYTPNRGGRAAVVEAFDLADSENAGYFRPEASLHIVFVSVSDDTGSSEVSTGDFLAELEKQRGLDRVTIYAVTQTTEFNCQGYPTAIASETIALVQQTGGFYESVCLADYQGFLSSVGQAIAKESLQDTFTLTNPAKLGSLSIVVQDGVKSYPWEGSFALVDPYTLVFPDTAPPPGARIEVSYDLDWTLVALPDPLE